MCGEKNTEKKLPSSRWDLNPQTSVDKSDALSTELLRTQSGEQVNCGLT